MALVQQLVEIINKEKQELIANLAKEYNFDYNVAYEKFVLNIDTMIVEKESPQSSIQSSSPSTPINRASTRLNLSLKMRYHHRFKMRVYLRLNHRLKMRMYLRLNHRMYLRLKNLNHKHLVKKESLCFLGLGLLMKIVVRA